MIPCPLLWLVPANVFRVGHPRDVELDLRNQFGCDTWLLDDCQALAFSFPTLVATRGIPNDYPLFLKLTGPMFRWLEPFLIGDCDALDLQIPDSRFWVRAILRPEETMKRYCMYMFCRAISFEALTCRAYASYVLTERSLGRVKAYLDNALMSRVPIHGESLRCGRLEFRRFQVPPSRESYGRDGFEVKFKSYEPVVWPWLELYLNIRRVFPAPERLSFEFLD